MEEFNYIKETLIKTKDRFHLLKMNIIEIERDISDCAAELIHIEEAKSILQTVSQKTQQELEYKISEIVSLALCAVFDDPYEFIINFVIKRGKTEAEIKFVKDGSSFDPLSSTGLGVVDIASFACRISTWNLKKPNSRNTIILDEPFKFLDKSQQHKAGEMLKMLSDKLGIQFIIVTHEEEIIESADKVFKVCKKGDTSYVTK